MKTLTFTFALLSLIGSSGAMAQDTTIKHVAVKATHTIEGPELYTEYCAVCHGKEGKGGGPAAAALKKQPSDLTQLARKNGGKFEALKVQSVITGSDVIAAHGTRDMPTWGTVFASLSSDEGTRKLRVLSLLSYIEKLQAK